MLAAMLLFISPVRAGEFFFPWLADKEPNPYETLRAPFADLLPESEASAHQLSPEEVLKQRLPENNVPMDKAHRQAGQIADIVGEFVAKVMLYQGDDYEADLAESMKLFDAQGQAAYKAFLEEKKLMQVLQSLRYYVRSYVEDIPIVLNAGPIDGRYRWLLEVPVIVSYMDRNEQDYKQGGQVTNQKFVIRLQVGRSEAAQNQDQLLIETWSGRAVPIDKI